MTLLGIELRLVSNISMPQLTPTYIAATVTVGTVNPGLAS